MKIRTINWMPALVAGTVVALVCGFEVAVGFYPALDVFQNLRGILYDWRVRRALKYPAPCATNLAAVYIDDETLSTFKDKTFGEKDPLNPLGAPVDWPFPRRIHGNLVRELAAQGARVVGFDILFDELQGGEPVLALDQAPVKSDVFFAQSLREAGNVALAGLSGLLPTDLLRTNAWAVADISNDADGDGVLRRCRPFTVYHLWHPAIKRFALQEGLDLASAQFEGERVAIKSVGGKNRYVIQVAPEHFEFPTENGPPVELPRNPAQPVHREFRVWHMGILLAARELGLDLDHPRIDQKHHRIVLSGPGGVRWVGRQDRSSWRAPATVPARPGASDHPRVRGKLGVGQGSHRKADPS